MNIKNDVADIVGSKYVSDDPEVLEKYSKDHSFVKPRKPSVVAYPANKEEVQQIVQFAYEHSIPLTPRSSSISFYGAGIPSQGGVVVDFSRMNKILEFHAGDRKVRIEPGVTWQQVETELEKKGMMVSSSLLPPKNKSALTSAMQREPILSAKYEYSDTFQTAEMILGNGQMYYTGTAIGHGFTGKSHPELFIPSNKLFMGAQGTLGFVTWAILKAEWIPPKDKVYFIALDSVEQVADPIYKTQRVYLGNECFALNNVNMAAILATNAEEFNKLKEALPPWVVILNLASGHAFPEEKIAYEEEALMKIAQERHFKVSETLAGAPGLERKLVSLLRKPYQGDEYWKFQFKGSSQEIFFITTLDRTGEFTKAMETVAAKHGYPVKNIGVYIQPVERARAVSCEYSFAFNPNDPKEVEKVRAMFLEASELVITMGGLFTNPYGPWADMVYSRAGHYASIMKVVKNAFDPKNIMNPGKLCF